MDIASIICRSVGIAVESGAISGREPKPVSRKKSAKDSRVCFKAMTSPEESKHGSPTKGNI